MNFAKLFQGIVIGALFSGILSGICAAHIALASDTTGELGLKTKDFWWVAMLLAGFFGLIAGGIFGGLISELNLSLIKAGLCGFLITAIPAFLFRIVPEVKEFGEDIRWFVVSFIVIATLTGVLVSYTQMSFFKSEL